MLEPEKFIDLIGYEDLYLISQKGRIFSKKNGVYLTPNQNKQNKIWMVKLSKDGVTKTYSCGRLVAMAFIKNENPKLFKYAIHIDGNKSNYTLDNMKWGTSYHSYQGKIQRYPELVQKFKPKKYNAHTQKMTPELTLSLLEYRKNGYSCTQLQDIFPIKKSAIAKILKKNGL